MDIRHKILIVDDEPKNIDILEFTLEDDFEIKSASTGETALEILPLFAPDIILLDIMMPGINGYEVCRKIKTNPQFKFTKIILVSGKSLAEERLKGYECGADDYITKPFDTDELMAKVKVYLKLKNTEEVDNIKSNFLSLISHETNTPLNGIIGLSELLLESENLTSDELESIKMIYESGYRLHELLDKARLLCELKTDVKLTKTVEPYYGIIANSYSIVKDKYTKDVVTDIDISHDILLSADWGLISKAVTMLIDNAIKFSRDGGTVEIYTKLKADICELYIVDHGPGIAEEATSKIFEEFSIEDVAHHSNGLGLSLATVKEIAAIHHGSVRVTSTQNIKTTFILTLPIK